MTTGPSENTVVGVVLAGGESTRFVDGNKALARLDGRPIVAHVVRTLVAATESQPLVAAGDREGDEWLASAIEEESSVEPTVVTDDADFVGPLAGLFGACSAVDAPWLFLTACDMPLLDADAVSWLSEQGTRDGTQAVVPRRDGGLEPTHALYRREALEGVRDDLDAEAGMHALVNALASVEYVDTASWPAGFERSLTDVNTVDELAEIRARNTGTN